MPALESPSSISQMALALAASPSPRLGPYKNKKVKA